jgi:ABC-type multidrug transport system fused ATPase/permease subunit
MTARPDRKRLVSLGRRYLGPIKVHLLFLIVLTISGNFLVATEPLFLAGMIETVVEGGGVIEASDEQEHAQVGGESIAAPTKIFDLNVIGERIAEWVKNLGKQGEGLGRFELLTRLGGILIFVVFLAGLVNYLSAVFSKYLRAKTIAMIRTDLSEHLFGLSLSFFNNRRSGDLLSRTITDAKNTAQGLVPIVYSFVHHGTLIVIYSVFLFSTSSWLTVGVITLVLANYAVTRSLGSPIRSRVRKELDQTAILSSLLQERFSAIKAIKSFVTEPPELAKLGQSIRNVGRADFRLGIISELEAPVRRVFDSLAVVGIILLAAQQVLNGGMSQQGAVAFIIVGRLLIAPITKISVVFLWVQALLASYDRLSELLEHKPKVISGTAKPSPFSSRLIMRNVSFQYENRGVVINNLSLEAKKGEVTALVGSSGAGKSTIVDLLLRFYDPEEGEIQLDGVDLKSLKISDYRRLFGVVPQESILYHDTIEENIRFGRLDISRSKVEEAAQLSNAHEFIEGLPLDYSTVVGDRGLKLSGGQRQRIAIARALAGNPEILILDEATSSLDTVSEQLVQKGISRALSHRTAIVIAHRLSTIVGADNIIFLEAGSVQAQGPHEELYQISEHYRMMWDAQIAEVRKNSEDT